MEYRKLINTDLELPIISLGTMTFGGQTDAEESYRIIDYAIEQGINFLDTANIYTGGESERIVGEAMKHRRESLVLATKVGYPSGTKLSDVCLSKEAIQREFDLSLQRLKTDYVDIYYMHAPDYNTPLEETLETLNELVSKKKVRYLGVSNHAAWQIADLMAVCEREGFAKPIITQNVYNAVTRTIEPELIPYLHKHPMGLTVYNPLAAGLLTDKHTDTTAKNTRLSDNPIYRGRYWNEANRQSAMKLKQIAKKAEMPLVELAFRWCISHEKVSNLICGVSKLAQIEENLTILGKGALSPEILEQCDTVWLEHTGNPFKYNR